MIKEVHIWQILKSKISYVCFLRWIIFKTSLFVQLEGKKFSIFFKNNSADLKLFSSPFSLFRNFTLNNSVKILDSILFLPAEPFRVVTEHFTNLVVLLLKHVGTVTWMDLVFPKTRTESSSLDRLYLERLVSFTVLGRCLLSLGSLATDGTGESCLGRLGTCELLVDRDRGQ